MERLKVSWGVEFGVLIGHHGVVLKVLTVLLSAMLQAGTAPFGCEGLCVDGSSYRVEERPPTEVRLFCHGGPGSQACRVLVSVCYEAGATPEWHWKPRGGLGECRIGNNMVYWGLG